MSLDLDPIVERAETVEEWRGVQQGDNEDYDESIRFDERERIALAILADGCSCTDSYCSIRNAAERHARIARRGN